MVEEFVLVEPSIKYRLDVMEYKKEFIECGDYINGGAGLTKINSYEDWLKRIDEDKKGKPPRYEFLMIRKKDNKIIGLTNIRRSLENGYEISGGHIGYSIRPSERGNGYANIILKLSLNYCRSLGIKKILVTCEKNNVASKKAILKNGGIIENEIVLADECIERYWINFQFNNRS